ncbi:MAG: HAMP domain-containing sensor histidine kinase [Acidimicrobiales bacterium]
MNTRARVATVVVIGFVAAVALAVAFGSGAHDTAVVVILAGLGSVCAAIAGDVASRLLRWRSLRTQVMVIGLTSTVTTAAGVLLAARWMFIEQHDVSVLAVVLVASSAVALGAATRLGASFEREAESVVALARQLAEPAPASTTRRATNTEEMRRVTAELHDVSRRLEASREREQNLETSRRELVAWVSHDLRSPIAAVRAMAEALEDRVVDDGESVDRYHRLIRQETERLSQLVDDLFELSRITAGALAPDDTTLPLGQLINDVLDSVSTAAHSRGIDVVAQIDDTFDALVPGSYLRRALQNVMDNAIRHTPVGGTVSLGWSTGEGFLRIDVSDECGGIPTSDLPRVFDVAFRGDTARTRDHGGGGLGLAIARGLLDLHHGTIEVDNRGAGCRFSLRLPVTVRS